MLLDIECRKCKGTGLYSGFAEKQGIAVVCHICDGTGCEIIDVEKFTERKLRKDIKRVYLRNWGFVLDFGFRDDLSISYKDFLNGVMPPETPKFGEN